MESESLVPFPFPKVSKLGNLMTVPAKINIHRPKIRTTYEAPDSL